MGERLDFELPDERATERFAAALAAALPPETAGWVMTLQGELGAGKTSVVRAVLQTLGRDGPVPSPTYTLVEPYELDQRLIYHLDLYRIAAQEELEFLGLDDLRDGLLLVEWPERAPELAADADLAIRFRYAGGGRAATVEARTRRSAAVLKRLAEASVSS